MISLLQAQNINTIKFYMHLSNAVDKATWADPERGAGGPDPPEKSQKYRVSKQYLKAT